MKRCFLLLVSLVLLTLTACDDKDPYDVPDDMVTVNLYNEDHGRTPLGNTDIYLNRDNNLVTSDYWLCDMGQVLDLGHVEENEADFNTLTSMAAADNYEGFVAFLRTDCRTFGSGTTAVATNAHYYRIWCDEWIREKKKKVGIVTNFAQYTPKAHDLPKWGAVVATLHHTAGEQSVTFVLDQRKPEVELDPAADGVLTLTADGKHGNEVTVAVNSFATEVPTGRYAIYVRKDNAFAQVWLYVD